MLLFFRKIRHDLITNSKFYRYLKYAFGEIVLVVLGILIAVAINNWNEERKNKQLESKTLLEIKKGLEGDLRDITINIERQELVLRSQEIVLRWLSSDDVPFDSLNIHFSYVSAFINIVSNKGPYENLKQVGYGLISNDSLRTQIMHAYEYTFTDYQTKTSTYAIFAREFLTSINKNRFKSYEFSGSEPINIEKIRTDSEYYYHVKTIKNINELELIPTIKRTKQMIEKTINMIEIELYK